MAISTVQKEKVLAGIATGLSQRDAAIYAGISPTTIVNLKKRDKAFAEQCEGAHVKLKGTCLQGIRKAGKKDWKALAWILERKFKKEFSKMDMQANLTTDELAAMDTEQKRQELEKLNKKLEKIDRRSRDRKSGSSK